MCISGLRVLSLSLFSSRMPVRVRGIPVPLVWGGGGPCLLPDLWSEVPLLPKGKADAEGGCSPVSWSDAPTHGTSTSGPEGSVGPSALCTTPHWGPCWSPCRCLDFQVLLSGHDTLQLPLPQPQSLPLSPVTSLLLAMNLQGWRGLTASFLISLHSLCAGHVVKL